MPTQAASIRWRGGNQPGARHEPHSRNPHPSRRGGCQTYWSQYTTTTTSQTTRAAGTVVNAADTAPTNDQWNLVAIELLSDD